MVQLKMHDFLNRVLTTKERVKFSQADPYGHLNTAQYVDMILNHRLEALTTLTGIDMIDMARTNGIAFVVKSFSFSFIAPCIVGEQLEISSWISEFRSHGMEVRGIIIGEKDRRTRAAGTIDFVTIDTHTGRPVAPPTMFDSNIDDNILIRLPVSDEYISDVKRLPEGWEKN